MRRKEHSQIKNKPHRHHRHGLAQLTVVRERSGDQTREMGVREVRLKEPQLTGTRSLVKDWWMLRRVLEVSGGSLTGRVGVQWIARWSLWYATWIHKLSGRGILLGMHRRWRRIIVSSHRISI